MKNMYRSPWPRSSRRGSAFLVAILFSGITMISVATYLNLVSREIPMAAKRIDRNRALEIADAGLEHALWFINDQYEDNGVGWWSGICEEYEEGQQLDDPEIVTEEGYFEEGVRYEVDIDQVEDTQSGRATFFMRATGYVTREIETGEGNMDTLKTMAVLTRPEGFSDFARFVASGNLTYAPGAILDGNVHTNGDLYVDGTEELPIIFRRRVSVGGQVNGNDPNEVFFFDELEEGADITALPDPTAQYRALAQADGIYHDPGGSSVSIDLSTLTYPSDFNGIVYSTKDIEVQGKPTRPVTLVAADDIYVTDHIEVADDPRHVVGLIAKDWVYLDSSTPNNLEVHAALMSIRRSWKALGSSGSKSGLTIKGSIVTKHGGSAGPYLGGVRNYIYDRRLLYYTPPLFPDFPGGNYILTAWLESPGEDDWREADLVLPDLEGVFN